MGRAAQDLDLEMQAAVVGGHHRIGKARPDREVRLRQALLQNPARADVAAGLLVVGDVQFDRPVQRRAAFFQREHGEGVGGDVGLRHGGAAPDHPAVDDLGAVRVARPARPRRHDVAVGVERDRRTALPEGPAHDQVGRADHAVGLDQRIGDLMPLDDKSEPFEELCDRLGRRVAVARRVVRRDLDDLGEEAGLGLLMGAQVFVDGGFGGHGFHPKIYPFITFLPLFIPFQFHTLL